MTGAQRIGNLLSGITARLNGAKRRQAGPSLTPKIGDVGPARTGPGIAEAASGGGSTPLRTRSRGREEANADSTLI
jgi:hypothetical protein